MLAVGDQELAMIASGTEPLTGPSAAEMIVEPIGIPVATPVVGPTDVTDGLAEVQIAELVTFAVVPSEYVPVAFSCVLSPTPANAGFGVIASVSRAAGVTTNVALPDMAPEVAVIILEPTPTDVASPEVAVTVATLGVSETQLTLLVKLAVLVSETCPVAVSCSVTPSGIVELIGVRVIDDRPLTKATLAILPVPLTR